MNVLIIAQYFPPDLGGSATRAYNLAKGLALNGCKVTVIAAVPHYPHGIIPAEYRWKPIKVEQMDNFKVIRVIMPPIKSEGFFKRLLLIGCFTVTAFFALPFIRKVDAVWASSWAPGYFYSKIKRKPLALNVDDLTLEDLIDLKLIDKDSLVLRAGEAFYRLFFVKGDIITSISSSYNEIIEKKYCVKKDRIHLIRGGVDLSIFRQSRPKPKHEKKFTVLYSGAFSVAYNFEQIFDAAKIIQDLDGDVEFVVQGAGELLASMNKYVAGLNLRNVKIIDKILKRPQVATLLSQADVLILPLASFYKSGNPYRGMSSKLYEYQAVGKPIIVCSRGVPSDYVEDSKSGIVVDPGDAQALTKAILELKNNPSRAFELGSNGRKYVEEEGSIEAVGLKMKKIFVEQ